MYLQPVEKLPTLVILVPSLGDHRVDAAPLPAPQNAHAGRRGRGRGRGRGRRVEGNEDDDGGGCGDGEYVSSSKAAPHAPPPPCSSRCVGVGCLGQLMCDLSYLLVSASAKVDLGQWTTAGGGAKALLISHVKYMPDHRYISFTHD